LFKLSEKTSVRKGRRGNKGLRTNFVGGRGTPGGGSFNWGGVRLYFDAGKRGKGLERDPHRKGNLKNSGLNRKKVLGDDRNLRYDSGYNQET